MEFLNHLFGEQSFSFHMAGVVFCLIGCLAIKTHYYLKHKAQCKIKGHHETFNLSKWLNENWVSLLMSVVISFVTVRFLDVFLYWVNPKMEAAVGFSLPNTEDQIFYYLAFGVIVQWWMHTKYATKK